MRRFIISALLALPALFTGAQEQVYTLSKCIEIGLENNYSLRITRNEELISHNNATLANAGYLPTLDLSAGYDAQLNSNNSELRGTGEVQKTRNAFDQTANAGINLNWTIFEGFNVSTNYKKLKELERMGETNTRIAIEDFIADMAAEYYNFIQQRLRLINYYNAVKLSKERLRIVEERYNIGNFSRLDYQQAKVDFNADSAQFMKQQEVVITSRIALNEMMAIDQVYTIIDTEEKDIAINDSLDFADLWNSTLGNNATLLLAAQNNTLAQLDYKKVLSRNYPYVKFRAGYDYGFNSYGNNTMIRRNAWGGNAGISIGFNLWDGNRRREMRNAKIEMENVKLMHDQLELSLKANLGNFWHAYQNNLQMLELEKTNVITARENHEIAKERYMLGDLSGIEMREAQLSLLQAEERLLSVEYDTKICEISLLLISGEIDNYLE
jgi:outer membrane protein TolC